MAVKRMKPTLAPWQCDHCWRMWYGTIHKGQWVPEGHSLCLRCWSELDEWLYRNFPDRYTLSWAFMKPEDIPFIHGKAKEWIADARLKPLRPKNRYRGGGIPNWMQQAIDGAFVQLNAPDVYIVIVENDAPVGIEVHQDRALLKKMTQKQARW